MVRRGETDHGQRERSDGGGARPRAAAEFRGGAAGGADGAQKAPEDPSRPPAQRPGHEDARHGGQDALSRPGPPHRPAHPRGFHRDEGDCEGESGQSAEPRAVAPACGHPEHE